MEDQIENQIENILTTGASQIAAIGAQHQDLLPALNSMLLEYKELCDAFNVDVEELPATINFLTVYNSFVEAMAKFSEGAV